MSFVFPSIHQAPEVAVRVSLSPDRSTLFRTLFRTVPYGMILVDLDGQCLAANGNVGRLFGIPTEQIVQMSALDFGQSVAARVLEPAKWKAFLVQAHCADQRAEGEVTVLCPQPVQVRWTVDPAINEEDQCVGLLWSFHDISVESRRQRNVELLREISSFTDPDPGQTIFRITQALVKHYGQTVSKISILDGDQMRFRFIAGDMGPAKGVEGLALSETYCQYALSQDGPLIVQDGREDERFRELLPSSLGFRRYLGIPIRDDEGVKIGTICIIDGQVERPLGDEDRELLESVAIRINAELARERFLLKQLRDKDEEISREREVLKSTQEVLAAMNDVFTCFFRPESQGPTQRLAKILQNRLGYSSCAVLVRAPDQEQYHGYVASPGCTEPRALTYDLEPAKELVEYGEASDLAIRSYTLNRPDAREIMGTPWVALGCLPDGQWGKTVVALGRTEEPPLGDPIHEVQLRALLDQVRLLLASTSLGENMVRTQATLDKTLARLVQSEKLSIVGTLAASTAHDIRNIVFSLALLTEPGQSQPEEVLPLIREQLDRFKALAHRLMSYARPSAIERTPINMSDLLNQVTALTAGQMRVGRVIPHVQIVEPLPTVTGDLHQLQHLLVNLILNAVEAMRKTGGSLALTGQATDQGVEILVADEGPGIAPEVAPRLFQAFASSRCDGFGLGLYSAQRIAEDHGGSLTLLENAKGATFRLFLPACGGAA